MRYITLNDMNMLIRKKIYRVPHDIDFVIGIPRSGMIPATIIAELINVPLIDVNSFCNGSKPSGGHRLELFQTVIKEKPKVLVVDDTIFLGQSITETKEKLKEFTNQYEFIYCAIYLEGTRGDLIDFYFEDIHAREPFFYEWNIFHHYNHYSQTLMYDIDGLLCLAPPYDERFFEEQYVDYIKNAIPLIIPKTKIGSIVTYRIAKYEDITKEWLEKYNIKYDYLAMFPASSAEERQKNNYPPEQFKAALYKMDKTKKLFIESDDWLAKRIHEISGKPVLCFESNILYN